MTSSQPSVQAASLGIDPEGTVGEVNGMGWSGPSDEQFFPLNVSGAQELELDIRRDNFRRFFGCFLKC